MFDGKCDRCRDQGLIIIVDEKDSAFGVCDEQDCPAGERLRRVLVAIAKGEPVILGNSIGKFYVEPAEPNAILSAADKLGNLKG